MKVITKENDPVEENWGPRSPLTVFISEDNGITFEKLLDLETQEGEFSYPVVISEIPDWSPDPAGGSRIWSA